MKALIIPTLFALFPSSLCLATSPIIIKNVTSLGLQLSPDVSDVSRDGGYSALINGNIVYFYDDTECFDSEGRQLSFVSNTAAYASEPNKNLRLVKDFGVVDLGKDKKGSRKKAILADSSVETGGWIHFEKDELDFNEQRKGRERVAIWPGTSPTPISTRQAFLFAPLVYVDSKPQDPSKEYQARGMTLITITAPKSGPVATRRGDLIIPGTEVAFGGFSTLVGRKSVNASSHRDEHDLDVYLIGMTDSGLQLARVGINDISRWDKYTFWDPQKRSFMDKAPDLKVKDPSQMYLPGTYSSGNVFFSPYFQTFLMVYFNKMTDSTFYIRYLDLSSPLREEKTWTDNGRDGKGIEAEDVEAIVFYKWSDEEKLYSSTPGPGGFNYAGTAHPEYFNRQYFAKSRYPQGTPAKNQLNEWYGSDVIPEKHAGGNGKNLLLSWTSQRVGGKDAGIYDIGFAVVEFDTIPSHDTFPSSTSKPGAKQSSSATPNSAERGIVSRLVRVGALSLLPSVVSLFLNFHARRGGVWLI